MTGPIIRAYEVVKRYGATRAVDGVTLDFREGEFFALLGPSGCGKTTLLRVLAGFETPDEGRVYLDGDDITGLRPNRRPVNMMFQSYALFPHMTVAKNVAYGLEMERVDRRERRERVDAVLRMTRLSELAGRRPDQLSGGQQQRVALARALVKRPRVVLLDEPLGALDAKLRAEMQLELKRIQHESGLTFVVVTHDQEEALVMADRVALMRDGRIEQVAPPRLLYDAPETRFAAAFIGTTNFVEGLAVREGLRFRDAVLPGLHAAHVARGAPATLSIRPERILLSDAPADGGLAGRVVQLSYHGQHENAHVAVPGIDRPLVARLGATQSLRTGQPVWLSWSRKHARILPAEPAVTGST